MHAHMVLGVRHLHDKDWGDLEERRFVQALDHAVAWACSRISRVTTRAPGIV